ncbi:hypothetical protein [Burkholderia sp. YIM B11467]
MSHSSGDGTRGARRSHGGLHAEGRGPSPDWRLSPARRTLKMIRAAEKMIETDTDACACLGNFVPRWITQGPGGSGFVEFADAILRTDPDNRG